MSDLLAIHDALAAVIISMDDGEEIAAWRLDEAQTLVASAHLPIRLILPPGATGGAAMERYEIVTQGMSRVVWRVADLLLYQNMARGGGPKNIWVRLTEYIGQYVQTLTANKYLSKGRVIGFLPQAGVFTWPAGGEAYHGVQVVLLVEETICV